MAISLPSDPDESPTYFTVRAGFASIPIGSTVDTAQHWLETLTDESDHAELAGYFDEIRRMTDQQVFEAMVSARWVDLKRAMDNRAAVRAHVWLSGQHSLSLCGHEYEKIQVGSNRVYVSPTDEYDRPQIRIWIFAAHGSMLGRAITSETSKGLAIQIAGSVAIIDGAGLPGAGGADGDL